jgi:hypothetical protein
MTGAPDQVPVAEGTIVSAARPADYQVIRGIKNFGTGDRPLSITNNELALPDGNDPPMDFPGLPGHRMWVCSWVA